MVSTTLLQPPTAADPAHTLAILKEAPSFLQSQRQGFTLPYPLSLLVNNESQEKWASYENILLAALAAGDYDTAKQCTTALTDRFGKLNERVLILHGMYGEAIAADETELGMVLKRYDEIIAESPTMLGLRKRRVALLKSMGKTADATASLVDILDNSPTDAEAWAELADLYLGQGDLEKSIFCLEEVLLIMPNAWNMQAKLGEVLLLNASGADGPEQLKVLNESIKRFCRSVELCSTYLRGFYGLKMASSRLLVLLGGSSAAAAKTTDSALLSQVSVQKLNQLATAKLAEITRNSKSGSAVSDGYNPVELAAAQALLNSEQVRQAR